MCFAHHNGINGLRSRFCFVQLLQTKQQLMLWRCTVNTSHLMFANKREFLGGCLAASQFQATNNSSSAARNYHSAFVINVYDFQSSKNSWRIFFPMFIIVSMFAFPFASI